MYVLTKVRKSVVINRSIFSLVDRLRLASIHRIHSDVGRLMWRGHTQMKKKYKKKRRDNDLLIFSYHPSNTSTIQGEHTIDISIHWSIKYRRIELLKCLSLSFTHIWCYTFFLNVIIVDEFYKNTLWSSYFNSHSIRYKTYHSSP